MDLRHLHHLVAIADRGSLLAAARALALSPAALTKAVQRLERELRVPLLDRSTRPARLTDAGRKAVERARHALGILDAIPSEVRPAGPTIEGRVRVGVGPLVADALLSEVTAQALRTAPRLAISARLGHWDDCLAALKLGESDLFLGDVTTAAADPTLVVRPFPSAPIALFGRAGHPVLRGRSVSAGDVLGWPLAANTPPPWGVRWLEDLHRRARRPVPDAGDLLRVVCDSVPFLRSVVAATDFLGFATPAAIDADVHRGRLAVVPFDTSDLKSNAGSVVVAGRSLSRAALLLRDTAHAVADRLAQGVR